MDVNTEHIYCSAYASRASRHGSRLYSLVAPTTVWTGQSTPPITMTGESSIPHAMSLLRMDFPTRYSLYIFLLCSIAILVPRRHLLLVSGDSAVATTQGIAPRLRGGLRKEVNIFGFRLQCILEAFFANYSVLHVRKPVRKPVRGYLTVVRYTTERMIDHMRCHWLLAVIYLHYQQVLNWLGRYKFRLIISMVGTHLLSTMIRSQLNKVELFMCWTEIQRYIYDPIPDYVFRHCFHDGSTSHYHR